MVRDDSRSVERGGGCADRDVDSGKNTVMKELRCRRRQRQSWCRMETRPEGHRRTREDAISRDTFVSQPETYKATARVDPSGHDRVVLRET